MKVKQKSLHRHAVVRQVRWVLLTLCVSCTTAPAIQAQELDKSFDVVPGNVQLTAKPAAERGSYRAAIIVTMPSGSHTYWKEPGDAGVPPVFAFNGSANIAKADVLFPVPTRLKEDGLEAFGYTDRVAFPVLVTLADPEKPATLHLDMSYAICNKICMPQHATGNLALPVKAGEDDRAIAAAFAAVPQPLPPAEAGQLAVTPLAGSAKPSWTLAWSGAPAVSDIFADAPEGFAFDTRSERPGIWTLVADQAVTAPGKNRVPVTLTLAAPGGALETMRLLDLPAAKP